MSLSLFQIDKSFGQHKVLDSISLEIKEGQLLSLLGPSGCGKTTLLRIIAGLEAADRGSIRFGGVDAATLDSQSRGVGFVFQNYALFRHMKVSDNISFGLRMLPRKQRPTREEMNKRVRELLALVQLEEFGDRYPDQLSGGQRQRVALARAIAVQPRYLLLDEPFGALDAKVRKELRTWLRRLQQELNLTCILVTHDQEEALELSDRVVLLHRGRVEQEGTPRELFDAPASAFALSFLGDSQQVQSTSRGPSQPLESYFVRPHEIHLERAKEGYSGPSARVSHISYRGAVARVYLQNVAGTTDGQLLAEIDQDVLRQAGLSEGSEVIWKPKRVFTFPDLRESDRR